MYCPAQAASDEHGPPRWAAAPRCSWSRLSLPQLTEPHASCRALGGTPPSQRRCSLFLRPLLVAPVLRDFGPPLPCLSASSHGIRPAILLPESSSTCKHAMPNRRNVERRATHGGWLGKEEGSKRQDSAPACCPRSPADSTGETATGKQARRRGQTKTSSSCRW